MSRMSDLLWVFARVPGLLVTGFLATVGSWGLGMGVMTMCTTTTTSCGATNAVLIVGWVVQVLLFTVALATSSAVLGRRLRRPVLAVFALAVPVVSIAAFVGVAWLADRSYCQPGSYVVGDPDNYCDVR